MDDAVRTSTVRRRLLHVNNPAARAARLRLRRIGWSEEEAKRPVRNSQEPSPFDEDPEVELLVEHWATRQLGGSTIQQIAAADICSSHRPQMNVLANFGKPYGPNLEIWSPMLHLPHVDCIDFLTIPRHEVMASMFEHCSAEFQDWVSGEPGAVREFRRSVKARDPRCMLAPPFDVRDVSRITVTGCLVAKVWCDPLTSCPFRPLWPRQGTRRGSSSSPSASPIPASRQCDGTEWTRCRIWETAIWSFRWLMHGT